MYFMYISKVMCIWISGNIDILLTDTNRHETLRNSVKFHNKQRKIHQSFANFVKTLGWRLYVNDVVHILQVYTVNCSNFDFGPLLKLWQGSPSWKIFLWGFWWLNLNLFMSHYKVSNFRCFDNFLQMRSSEHNYRQKRCNAKKSCQN